ncbi:MAG TPA: hypothetical protein VHE80_10740, partial [Acidimicrobiales bacterium]|nr:hypothetical protein [Acidimicrobiales bacterium]
PAWYRSTILGSTYDERATAGVSLAVATEAKSPTARKRAVTRAMKEVAHYLGNTPAVARSSYVDPRIVDRYHAGQTIATHFQRLGEEIGVGQPSTQGAIEEAVLDLLDDAPDAQPKVA